MSIFYKGTSMTGLSRTEADNLYATKEDLDNLETSSKDLSSGTTFVVDLGSSDPPQQDAEIEVYADEFVGFKPEVSDQTHNAIVRCNNDLYFTTFKVTAVGPESATVKFIENATPATNLENYYDKDAIDELLNNLATGDVDLSDYVTKEEFTDAIDKKAEATLQSTGYSNLIKIVGVVEGSPLEPISKIEFLQEGEGAPSLTNVRNIVGLDSIELRHSGKNLLDTEKFHNQANWESSSTITGGYDYDMTLPKGTYTISFPSNVDVSQYLYVFVGGTQTNMIQAGLKMSSYTFAIDEETTVRIFEFGYSITSIADNSPLKRLQIEEGTEATTFEPYTAGITTYVQTFDDTVYSGSFNWRTGELTLTHRLFELAVADMVNTSSDSYPGWMVGDKILEVAAKSFNGAVDGVFNIGYRAGINTMSEGRYRLWLPTSFYNITTAEEYKERYPDLICQFLFPLLEPKVIKLERHQIAAISGTNVLSSDSLLSVTYQLDLKEYIDNKTPNVDVDLSNYYTKEETYSKEEVDTKFDELELPEGGGGDVFPVKAPVGSIVVWSGTEDNIPTGWQLCDGTNNTPDLRDKFVLGAGPSHAVGTEGGEAEVTLTESQMPSHVHTYQKWSMMSSMTNKVSTTSTQVNNFNNASTTTGSKGGDQPHNNMPPFYALCFIMKIKPDETDGGTQFTTDDTLTMSDTDVLSVTTPVHYATSEEYDNMSTEEKSGLWIVTDEKDYASGSNGTMSIGTIISFMGMTAPDDYLVCDGSIYNISDYKHLANFFKQQFGTVSYFGGDGTTTFAVPDLRNLFLRGYHGDAEKQLSGDVGERQSATTNIAFYVMNDNGYLYAPKSDDLSYTAPTDPDEIIRYANLGMNDYAPKNTYPADGSTVSLFSSRPLNTAVLFCIKAKLSITPSEVYSSEESIVGSWFDKPIYRRTVSGTISSDAINSWTTLVEVPDIENLVDFIFFMKEDSGHFISMDGLSGTIGFDRELGVVNLFTMHSEFPGREFYGFISYTKSTD